jgi:hypothetical protein
MLKVAILLYISFFLLPIYGQDSGTAPAPLLPEVDSTWPGIRMRIPEVKRIPGNRLLFAVCLFATAKAPPATLIGTPGSYSPEATLEERSTILVPTPFSLHDSTMVEEHTQQKYGMLSPDPKGPVYRPGFFMGTLSPGQNIYMTIQFPAPPPPLPDENGQVPKQTVSILLPKAQGPIMHIVIPPAAPAASAVP